jgi:hypothetical protein
MTPRAQKLVAELGYEGALDHAYLMATMTRDLEWLKVFLDINKPEG